MSLARQLGARFRAQLASKFAVALTGGLLTVGLARLLTPADYGLLLLALAVTSAFQLISRFGISGSAGRYVAEYKEKDPSQVPFIVRTSFLLNAALVVFAVAILVASRRQVARVLGEPALEPFLLVGALFVALGTSITFLEKVVQGLEDIEFVSGLSVFADTSRLLAALGLVVAGFGAIGALWGYVASAFLTSLIGFGYLYRRVRGFYDASATAEPGLRRRIAEYAVPITATNASRVLDNMVDTLLVGFFLGPVAVSYYVIGGKVVRFVETPMLALSFTLSPTFGAQKAAGNVRRISRIYEETLVNVLLLYVPAGVGVILVAEPLIELVFGPSYRGAVVVLQVLGVYVIVKAVTKISDNGLDFLGRARERAIARGVTSVMNVGLNVLLIPTMGVVGAAIATVITFSLYTAANLYITAQEFELRTGYLLRNLGRIAVITGLMSAIVYSLVEYVTGWATLAVVVVAGVVVWAVLSIATGLLDVRKVMSVIT